MSKDSSSMIYFFCEVTMNAKNSEFKEITYHTNNLQRNVHWRLKIYSMNERESIVKSETNPEP